jgi:SAM-dependent methyltransferase
MPGTDVELHCINGKLVDAAERPVGVIEGGIVRIGTLRPDASIEYFRSIDGTHFLERSAVAYSMTALDTPVYRSHLEALAPPDRNSLIVDIGGGDGRNTLPWLEWGFRRVVVVDPVAASLQRLRAHLAAHHAEWLDRVLLIEADARRLPLRGGSAGRILAIEALCYLNEDYERGVAECKRALASAGRLLVSDRDHEGGMLARLLYYGGVEGMLDLRDSRDLVDGLGDNRVRSRCFTRAELIAAVERQGLKVVQTAGISAFSLVLGYLRNIDRLGDNAQARVAEVHALLDRLGRTGSLMRSHIVVAEHAGAPR